MEWEAWHVAIHGVTKSQTRLSDWTELNWIHISPLLNLSPHAPILPLQIITECQSGLPVLYSSFSPAVHFTHDSVYMLMLWYYFLHSPLSLPPLLCPQVSSPHLCFHSFPVNKFVNTIFLDFIYVCVNIWYLIFSFWLTSLCITDSRFPHLTRTDSKQSDGYQSF